MFIRNVVDTAEELYPAHHPPVFEPAVEVYGPLRGVRVEIGDHIAQLQYLVPPILEY